MEINFKEFKKKLIDDDLTIKEWCFKNDFDRDRLKNIQSGIVKATPEEIEAINKYAEG
jgi:hypothetical protein